MTDNQYLIGVDGGGSKTLALVADAQGHILGRGTAGSSNYQTIGAQAAQAAILQAISAAYSNAGLEYAPGQACAACLGLSGVDRPEDQLVFNQWAQVEWPRMPALVVNDAQLVLAAGTPEGWGAGLICGTGSIVFGHDREGHTARSGGWGWLLGDEGSGYAIGLAALRAVTRAADGRGPRTALMGHVLGFWSLARPEDLIGRVYQRQATPREIAQVAALVEEAADEGDIVSQAILQEAGHELALAVRSVIGQLGLQGSAPCALAGSVIVKGKGTSQAFRQAVAALELDLDPIQAVEEPAQGAIRLAQNLAEGK